MTPIAPHITAFLQQHLPVERRASDHTCDSYAYAFKLLFEYASRCLKVPPSQLHLEQLDAPLIINFLGHLETARGNGPIPEIFDWPPSNRSCTSWSIVCRRL